MIALVFSVVAANSYKYNPLLKEGFDITTDGNFSGGNISADYINGINTSNILLRDGSTTLTSNWNTGGKNINMSSGNLTNVNAINPSTTILNIFASQTFFWNNINMTNKNITKVGYINPMGDELRIGGNLNITGNINAVRNITTDVHYFNTVTVDPACVHCMYSNGTGTIIVG
jgi:hypothetical protein